MGMIGGNITAQLQKKNSGQKNAIGGRSSTWETVAGILGWLDLMSGDSRYTSFNAKMQESTHIFLSDWQALNGVTAENSRLIISGEVYDITLIDNPMEKNRQLEFYLKYKGGGNNVD